MNRRARIAWFAALGALVAAAPTVTQAADPLATALQADPPATALDCLTPKPSELPPLTYSPEAIERKQDGIVRVRLTFTQPDEPPAVEVFYLSSGYSFVEQVKTRVAVHRLPCLVPGSGPVVAVQEFHFTLNDGRPVFWSPLRDEPQGGLADKWNCLVGGEPERRPVYPRAAAERGEQGIVLARMRFTSPIEPPAVEIRYDAKSRALSQAVREHVDGYRMPCLQAGQPPLVTTQSFEFRFEGEPTYVLRDLSLRQLVGAIDDLDRHRVRFDFGSMGCPFDVKVAMFQPYLPNRVGEVGTRDANRREFVEWLTTVRIKLPQNAERRLIGDTITVSVPCGVLDLL